MDAVFYAIGDSFDGLFNVMANLGNIPNVFIVITIISLFLIWTRRLILYRNAGDNE